MDSSPRSPQSISNSINVPLFKVFLRLRPSSSRFSKSETRFLNTAPGQSCIYVTPPADRSRHKATEKFAFTRIFEETSEQREIFEETVLPLLGGAVIGGQDGTLATLGVTGSGKTYTILGNDRVKGMTQMALEVLFNAFGERVVDFNKVDLQTLDNSEAIVLDTPTFHERMQSSPDGYSSKRSSSANITTPNIPSVSGIKIPLPDTTSRYGVLISMYELYNDRVFDLLIESPSASSSSPKRKALIFKKPSSISAWDTSKEQKKVVSGLRKVYAASYAEALQIIEHGQANRTVSTTHNNNASSRSHAFLQIEIKRFSSRNTERGSANLCIVDLAGSERSRTAKPAGERLAEAGSINRSLMCLGQCLQLQNQGSDNGKPSIVPWRQSKLTELLFSNSFSGAGSGQGACMIVTADAMGDFSATSQILRYSALAREVSAPRLSRSLSTCSSSSSCSESAVNASICSITIATDLTVPPLSAAPEEPSKDTIIARLLSKLHEAESRIQLAEERYEQLENQCLFIEQTVREEVADDMELRLEEARRSMLERLKVEEEWREGYVDGKIEIMKRGIQVHEDAPRSVYLRIEEIEDENQRLRRELMQLKREASNRSPSKGQIPREVREAVYRTPSKGQVVKGRKGSKPLKDMSNLDTFRGRTLSGER